MSTTATWTTTHPELADLPSLIRQWAAEFGFADVGITNADTGEHADHLKDWLAAGYQGEMDYMAHHGDKRYTPGAGHHAGYIRENGLFALTRQSERSAY